MRKLIDLEDRVTKRQNEAVKILAAQTAPSDQTTKRFRLLTERMRIIENFLKLFPLRDQFGSLHQLTSDIFLGHGLLLLKAVELKLKLS